MKITASSTFHGTQVEASFIDIREGVNVRRLPRNHCCGSHGCECGFPSSCTHWFLPDGYVLREQPRVVGRPGSEDYDYGKGWIEVSIVQV